MKLNLGCGKDIKEGYINLDKYKYEGVNIIHNLEKIPYPFKDNYFDEIYASKILEHIDVDFDKLMNELIRTTKPDGIIKILIPHFSSSYNYYPTHIRTFTYMSFLKEKGNNLEMSFLKNVDVKTKIIFEKRLLLFFNYFMEFIVNKWKFPIHYERTCWRNLFPANYMDIEIKVRK